MTEHRLVLECEDRRCPHCSDVRGWRHGVIRHRLIDAPAARGKGWEARALILERTRYLCPGCRRTWCAPLPSGVTWIPLVATRRLHMWLQEHQAWPQSAICRATGLSSGSASRLMPLLPRDTTRDTT